MQQSEDHVGAVADQREDEHHDDRLSLHSQ